MIYYECRKGDNKMKTLRQWIEETAKISEGGVIQDLDLLHEEEDIDYATMCEVNMGNFEPAGLERFASVLNAEVTLVRPQGNNYYEVFVKGVSASKVEALSRAHSGMCSVDNYNRWFTDKV